MKKPRGDSKLKTLPPALQENLYQALLRMTQEAVIAWLKEKHDISTSPGALSNFYDWYQKGLTTRMARDSSLQLENTLKNLPDLKITADQASQVAQVNFELMAAQNHDVELYLALRRDARERGALAIAERKVKLLEAQAALADQAKAVGEDKDLTEAEQLARYRQIFGG